MPAFGGNAAFNFLKSSTETKSSIKLNFLENFSAVKSMNATAGGTFTPSPEAIADYDDLGLKSQYNNPNYAEWSFWRERYGDSYVNAVNVAANLAATVTIQFENTTSKDLWNLMIQGKLKNQDGSTVEAKPNDLANLDFNIGQFNNATHSSVSVTVAATQLGGDALRLSEIFIQKNPDADPVYPALECSPTDLQSCKDVIKSVINYSASVFPQQFMKNPAGSITNDNLDTSKFYITGIAGNPSAYPTKIRTPSAAYTLSTQISAYANQATKDEQSLAFVRSYLNDRITSPYLDTDARTSLADIERTLNSFINNRYTSTALKEACFSQDSIATPSICLDYIAAANQERASVLTKEVQNTLNYLANHGYSDSLDDQATYFNLMPVGLDKKAGSNYVISNVNYHQDFTGQNKISLAITSNGKSDTGLKINPSTINYKGANYVISTSGECPIENDYLYKCNGLVQVSAEKNGTEEGITELKQLFNTLVTKANVYTR